MLLLVSQILEPLERLVQRILTQLIAQGFQLLAEAGAPCMLAHDQIGATLPHRLRAHDLIGATVLQHAVLMDTAFMGKGVLADDGLIELYRKAGDR